MKKCEKCNSEMGDDVSFCTKCGAPLGASQADGTVAAGDAEAVVSKPDAGAGMAGAGMSSAGMSSAAGDAPKKKNGLVITLAIVSAICLAVGITGIVLALTNNNGGSSSGGSSSGSSSSSGGSSNVTPSGNGGGTVDTPTGVKVSYDGFEFTIPDGYEYEVGTGEDGQLTIVKGNDYIASVSYSEDITFASIKSSIDLFAETFTEEFGAPVAGNVVTAGGTEFVVFDGVEVDGLNVAYAYSEAEIFPFQTIIITNPGTEGKQYLADIASILSSAKKKTSDKVLDGGDWDIESLREIKALLNA